MDIKDDVRKAFNTLFEALLLETAHDNTRIDRAEAIAKISDALIELEERYKKL